MSHSTLINGCQFAYQIERLYWKATTCRSQGREWRAEFGQLETEIRQQLSESERAKLLRTSRTYQRLQKIAA